MTFGLGGFASVADVNIEAYTSAFRVTGTIRTPFRRVAEILTQLPSGHLAVERARVIEHATPEASSVDAGTVLVALEEILLLVASGIGGEARAEMRVSKQPIDVGLGIPPFHLRGTLHVPVGTDPSEGLTNLAERFVPMTDARLSSAPHPHLERDLPVLAVRRDRAQVIVLHEAARVAGDEPAEGLVGEQPASADAP